MKLHLLVATGLIFIAGCNRNPAQTEPPATVAGEDATSASAADRPVAPTYPADYRIDQAIPAANIKTELALAGAPVYQAKDDVLLFNVEVTNSGKSPLASTGKAPVQLAIHLAGPEGVDKPPGKRLVARASLPLIVEGSSGLVKARVPAEQVLGQTIRVELFQEGVGWFGRRYNQPTLDIGTFQRCDGASGTLCDASGTPLMIQ